MTKLLKKLWLYIKPFLNIKILIVYIPIWFIFSGWTYLFIYLGIKFDIKWMYISGSTWSAFLWMPFTPEKLVTIPLTIKVYMKLFKENNPSLERMLIEAKQDFEKIKRKFKKK